MSEPTITDEELARFEKECHEAKGLAVAWYGLRAISALRAERQRAATLTARLESCERMREASRLRAERLERDLEASRDEMERVKRRAGVEW